MTTINAEPTQKKIREIALFSNRIEVNRTNNTKTMIHEDNMPMYNTWHLLAFHLVDEVIFRGPSSELPTEYHSYLEKLGNPKNVIVTKSSQDTY
jgi:hypothetical protein